MGGMLSTRSAGHMHQRECKVHGRVVPFDRKLNRHHVGQKENAAATCAAVS
jgi:hypothetical protein